MVNLLILIVVVGPLSILLLSKLREYILIRKTIKDLSVLVNLPDNNDRQVLIAKFTELRRSYSDLALIEYADKYSWPKEILTCLPTLYFCKGNKSFECIIWKEVLEVAPVKKDQVKIYKKYCNEELLTVSLHHKAFEIINNIAIRVENVRIGSPYKSYVAFLGAVNQTLSDLELETKLMRGEVFSEEIAIKRKQFLIQEMDVEILSLKKND